MLPSKPLGINSPQVEKEKKIAAIAIVIIIILSTAIIGIISYYEVVNVGDNSNYWMREYHSLDNVYNSLVNDYNDLVSNYNNLQDEYQESYAPLVSIENRTINWRFYLLDGTLLAWSLGMETYLSYATMSDPTENNYLELSETGQTFTVINLSNYVTPDFFKEIISTLTTGKTDIQFVHEVVNIKNQLVTYSTGLEGEHRWPAETLTEGTGNCGDTSILMASLLKAGENEKNYGLTVKFWYCDSDHMTDPQDVNHVVVEVEYEDGTNQLIETTSDIYYSYDQIVGWPYEV